MNLQVPLTYANMWHFFTYPVFALALEDVARDKRSFASHFTAIAQLFATQTGDLSEGDSLGYRCLTQIKSRRAVTRMMQMCTAARKLMAVAASGAVLGAERFL